MFFKKKKDISKRLLNTSINGYESRPFDHLDAQLTYTGCNLLFEEDGIKIFSRIKNGYLLVIYLIENYEKFEFFNIDNNFIKENIKKSDFDVNLLDGEKQSHTYIFKIKNDETKKMTWKLSDSSKNVYKMGLLYNQDKKLLEEYTILQENKFSYHAYLSSLFFCLGCKDNMEVED